MNAALDELFRWVAQVRVEDVPPSVRANGRARVLAGWAAARDEGVASLSEAPRVVAAAERDDPVLGGRTGLVAPFLALHAEGADLDHAVVASIIADEVGARLGLASLLGDRGPAFDLLPAVVGGAAARAWLEGADAAELRRAVEAAVTTLGAAVDPDAVWGTLDADVAGGQSGALEEALRARSERPLLVALTGAGRVWLAETAWIRRFPGPLAAGPALEALDTILERHVKAADKRLRADQVEGVEIRVAQPAWRALGGACGAYSFTPGAESQVAGLVGTLIAHHDLTPASRSASGQANRAGEIARVAERVRVVHDWSLTAQAWTAWAGVVAPLAGGARGVAGMVKQVRDRGAWPCLGRTDVLPLLRSHPERWFAHFGTDVRDLAALDLHAWSWPFPTLVRLATTRGGNWPERRTRPQVPTLVEGARMRHPRADALLAVPGNARTDAWLAEVLA